MYCSGIEHGYLLPEGILSHHTYINTVAFGLALEKFKWVENFIFSWKNKVARKYREGAFNFCLARLRYLQKDYPTAMKLIAEFDTEDPYYFLIAKVLLSRMFYEGDELDSLESLLDSMTAFLKRNPMDKKKKDHFKQIIRLTRRLINLAPYNPSEKARILSTAVTFLVHR